MWKIKKSLNEAYGYSYPNGNGIFSDLQKLAVPWADKDIAAELDAYFYGNYAGDKIVPMPIRLLAQGNGGVLSQDNRDELAKYTFTIFGSNWQKLYDTLSFEYDPISNYDMTEHESGTQSGTDKTTGTDTENGSDSTTETRDLTSTDGGTVETQTSGTSGGSVYGFNSAASVPATAANQQGTDNETRNLTGTDSGTVKRESSHNIGKDISRDTQTSGEHDRTLTRKGNIGVTTSQQMVQSERELWLWNYFLDTVFPNVARVLTLDIY